MVPQALSLAFVTILGAVVGSFLNVCIYRLPWEKSIIWPGSHCPHCLQPVRAFDNIPILSWFILRGRCRGCGAGFSPRYALIEAATAALFGVMYWLELMNAGGTVGRYLIHLVLVAALIVATFIDIDLQIIPDSVTVPVMLFGLACAAPIPDSMLHSIVEVAPDPVRAPGMWLNVALVIGGWCVWVLGLLWFVRRRESRLGAAEAVLLAAAFVYLVGHSAVQIVALGGFAPAWPGWQAWFDSHPRWHGFATSLVGLLVGAGTIWFIRIVGTAVFRREAMGFGDVVLLAMVGAFLGWQPVVIVFFIAPFFGLVTGVAQWLAKGQNVIPYGPYLALGSVVALLGWRAIWPRVVLHFQLLAMIPVAVAGPIVALIVLVCLARIRRLESAAEQKRPAEV